LGVIFDIVRIGREVQAAVCKSHIVGEHFLAPNA